MRGGLGRTLLIAFLILSIVPLSLISYVASTQAQRNLQRELKEKLVTIATLTEAQIHSWIESQQVLLAILSDDLSVEGLGERLTLALADCESPPIAAEATRFPASAQDVTPETLPDTGGQICSPAPVSNRIAEIRTQNPAFMALLLLDQEGRILAAHPPTSTDQALPDVLQSQQMLLKGESAAFASPAEELGRKALILKQPLSDSELTLVALLDPQKLIETIRTFTSWSNSGEIYLVSPAGPVLKFWPANADTHLKENQNAARTSLAIEAGLAGQSGVGSYENYRGTKVMGAYRWLPQMKMALLVEQPRDVALAASDDLAIVLIGAALAVALLTALIAAAVTRRITLPIVQMTATAVQIAAGDLDQKVPATRRDEIGILARAFNVMTTKLRVLYEGLEQQVRERTQQLREANAEVSYRAMQLAISAEVARVITSILDREVLFSRVVELIRDCFQAYFVALYSIDEDGQWAELREGSGGLGDELKAQGHRVDLSQNCLVSQTANSLEPHVCAGPALDHRTNRHLFPHTRAELTVPLKIGQRKIGVLDVHSIHEDAFVGDEIMILETLAGQIAVAMENARVYQMERQAAEQLRELEELRRRFLANMSRELRMPLNNIIGFSRVILKEIDGPITELQRRDLNAVHESGQQLLALINDILDIAQIEAGAMELSIQPVDLGEIAHSVIPTINALIEGQPIDFRHDVRPNLPPVLADPYRLRQVLVKLLSNAAKFTPEGEIKLSVWSDTQHIIVSVKDTGIGIPDKDREKVFEMFRQLSKIGANTQGTGLGLTFSKEIVEMHGGSIWLESKEGVGSTFTFMLPIIGSDDGDQAQDSASQ